MFPEVVTVRSTIEESHRAGVVATLDASSAEDSTSIGPSAPIRLGRIEGRVAQRQFGSLAHQTGGLLIARCPHSAARTAPAMYHRRATATRTLGTDLQASRHALNCLGKNPVLVHKGFRVPVKFLFCLTRHL